MHMHKGQRGGDVGSERAVGVACASRGAGAREARVALAACHAARAPLPVSAFVSGQAAGSDQCPWHCCSYNKRTTYANQKAKTRRAQVRSRPDRT